MIQFTNISSIFNTIGSILISKYRDVIKRTKKVATGKTIAGIKIEGSTTGITASIKVIAPKSLQHIEKGRRKGAKLPVRKVGDRFELVPALEEWKRAVGYKGSDYMLAKGISERGIKPTPITQNVIKESAAPLLSITTLYFSEIVANSAFADMTKILKNGTN
jgi:hypothetical protein